MTLAPDDIVQGCYKYLLTKADIVASVGSQDSIPFIFNEHLATTIAGKSTTAIVVSGANGWAGPISGSSAEFPRLRIDVYSDPPRDGLGNVTLPVEARTQAYATYQVLNRYMHRLDSKPVYFGTILTFRCSRLGEPAWIQNPKEDKVGKLTAYYGVECTTAWTSSPD